MDKPLIHTCTLRTTGIPGFDPEQVVRARDPLVSLEKVEAELLRIGFITEPDALRLCRYNTVMAERKARGSLS